MRVERLTLGQPPSRGLVGAILARDLMLGNERWSKGRRLGPEDLERLGALPVVAGSGRARTVTLLIAEPGELHEDDAALRLAAAVAGPNLVRQGPLQSRVDLRATAAGVVSVRLDALERIDAIDPLEVFTVLDGQVVKAGDLVASVKIAPHVVAESVLEVAERIAARSGPVVRVDAFRPRSVAVLVKESLRAADRQRFEATMAAKIEGLGSAVSVIRYIDDEVEAAEEALAGFAARRGGVPLVLTAGAASTDPTDPIFLAIQRLGGTIIRQGVPAHPGSMLWLARIDRTIVLGLPTCGAYSRATAVDLLLPRLLAGQPATARTVARLGHGGVLTREMRFRMPAYARDLEAPEG
ncbi:MAG: molybdopterin-binding protein [Candidatus Limnocylindrales bacterium]